MTVSFSNWDASNVASMIFIFTFTLLLNSNVSKWNVSNVLDMQSMFSNTKIFEGIELDQWILYGNVHLTNIFCNAKSLD